MAQELIQTRSNVQINGFSLNLVKGLLKRGDQTIALTPKESKILALLIQNTGNLVTRKTLMEHVWETDYMGDTRTLDVHICWLRQKLEKHPQQPKYIVTKRGKGYILQM